jgi:HPt (histidine-containing phosphotransfer) domain-containing protein
VKGVAGAIGADDLQQAAAKLEASLKKEPGNIPKTLLTATGKELDRILGLLGELVIGSSEDVSSSAELPEDLAALLQSLLEKLEEYDSEAEELLEDIMSKVTGTVLHPTLQALKKRVGKYDFETAADELKTIIKEYS